MLPDRRGEPLLSEEGTTSNAVPDMCIRFKARIWPGLSYMCHILSEAVWDADAGVNRGHDMSGQLSDDFRRCLKRQGIPPNSGVHFWSFKKILAGQSGNKAKVSTVFPSCFPAKRETSSPFLLAVFQRNAKVFSVSFGRFPAKRAQRAGFTDFNQNLALTLPSVPSLLDNGMKFPVFFSRVGHGSIGGWAG